MLPQMAVGPDRYSTCVACATWLPVVVSAFNNTEPQFLLWFAAISMSLILAVARVETYIYQLSLSGGILASLPWIALSISRSSHPSYLSVASLFTLLVINRERHA